MHSGGFVLYFPVKVAVARLGGPTKAASALGVTQSVVRGWITPTLRCKPEEHQLVKLSVLSGVSMSSFNIYYERLAAYKEREGFRRRA